MAPDFFLRWLTSAMLTFWLLMGLMADPPAVASGAAAVRPGGEAQRTLTGAGVTIGLWDLGFPRTSHQTFASDRVSTFGTGMTDTHATGAAGAMIGIGMGQAPSAQVAARLFSSDFGADLNAMRSAAQAGLRLSAHPYEYQAGWSTQTGNCAGPLDWAWFGTASVSTTEDVIFGLYHQRSADWDDAVHDHPRWLPFIAAGNQEGTGPGAQPVPHCAYDEELGSWVVRTDVRDLDSGITYMGVSKNVLTVGTWPNDPSTGRGPASDGRVKPDLVAPATLDDAPTSAADDSFGSFTKTSAAVSVAAGSAALLLEHLRTTMESDPLASTVKALLIHAATDVGDAGPDGIHGWGRLDIERAVRYAEVAQVVESELADAGIHSMDFHHDGFGDLVATLVWTDPAGTPGQAALVNDLDLRITGPGGPWLPLALGGGTADNTVDNVEQVRVAGLPAGTYAVQVTHKGVLVSPQAFSLVASSGDPRIRRFTLDQAGWRLVSLPFTGAVFSRLDASFTTQYGSGADPTLYRFTAPSTYTPVTDPGDPIAPGDGFLMYLFEDDLPKTWVINGTPNTARIESAMPWHGSPADSYRLAGHPFTGVLDWDAVVAASTGIANTYHVWDPSGSDGGGTAGFRHYTAGNPGVGTTGRHIPAFIGFFVSATGPDAVLVLDPDQQVRGSSPTFHGKEATHPMIKLAGESGEAVISFHPDASAGWDAYDVPRLAALDGRRPVSVSHEGREFAVLAVPEPESAQQFRLTAPARIIRADVPARMIDERTLEIGPPPVPTETALLAAYPNPFNPSTVVRFTLDAGRQTALKVYDILGREVAVLVDGGMPAGTHSVAFDATGLASGVYLVRLTTQIGTDQIRITLVR